MGCVQRLGYGVDVYRRKQRCKRQQRYSQLVGWRSDYDGERELFLGGNSSIQHVKSHYSHLRISARVYRHDVGSALVLDEFWDQHEAETNLRVRIQQRGPVFHLAVRDERKHGSADANSI